jgi:hypothetical protein
MYWYKSLFGTENSALKLFTIYNKYIKRKEITKHFKDAYNNIYLKYFKHFLDCTQPRALWEVDMYRWFHNDNMTYVVTYHHQLWWQYFDTVTGEIILILKTSNITLGHELMSSSNLVLYS